MNDKSAKLESDSGEPPKFTVNDRRHWVVEEEEGILPDESSERLPSYVEQLKKEAEEKDQRLREYIQAYKTKTAETDEFRQRLTRENESRLEQVKANFFQKLVPLADNLKRALDAAGGPGDFDSLKQGVGMILSEFHKELQLEGITVIEAEGKPFDPSMHEACMSHDTDNAALDNMVLEQLESGYLFNDKLIKAAKVKVARLKPA